ncbi:MAG: GGDEF domain-containing protein [Chloroflexota bacterium]|nr:GGDEF domain-containing protein [Chloroflexota bacterium]
MTSHQPQDEPEHQPPVPEADREATGRVQAYVWGFRILTAVLATSGMAAVLATHAHGLISYLIVIPAFLTPLGLGLVMAAMTRIMHVRLERRLRARLYIRSLELQDMAMRDDLTQLFNRRYFYDRLQRELDEARDFERSVGVVMLDVDGLKAINDTHGHKVGDVVLSCLGRLLVQHTRAGDVPARIGGDEFAVIVPATDKRGVPGVARRLRQALEGACQHCPDRPCDAGIRLSVGTSGYPWGGNTVDEIMRLADAEMYADKVENHRQRSAVASRAPV